VPFQSKEVGCFFGPWTAVQGSGSGSLFDIVSGFHSRAKQAQTGRESFLFYRMPDTTTADACIVFRYKGIK